MKHKFKLSVIAILMTICMIPCALASVVSPTDDFWYYDEANVLSEETEGLIFFANQQLFDAAGAEIVVVAVEDTENLSTEDYAYTLFNDWGIGGDNNRGFLLLLSIEDDDYYAMLGTMMEPYFDSATVSEYLNQYLEPDFADKDYDSGVRKFFEVTYEHVVDIFNLNLSLQDAKTEYQSYKTQNSTGNLTAEMDHDMALLYDDHDVFYERELSFSQTAIILILILITIWIVSATSKHRRRYNDYDARPIRRGPAFWPIFIRPARRRPPHNPPPPHGFGGRPPFDGGSRSRPNDSFGRNHAGRAGGGFSGNAHRSGFGGTGGFGGASRGGSSRPSSGGGFGGASRSGSGGSRGGGAGRGGRR